MAPSPPPPQATFFEDDQPAQDDDNITDWALEQFQAAYNNPSITKDDIWEYLYGVMHAPDWRKRYKHDLQRNLPRIPFAADFESFRWAGRELIDLHINYESIDEYPVRCEVDGIADEGDADSEAYRITGRTMRWARVNRKIDKSTLEINPRCRLVGIPPEADQYKVSGRSPLEWAIASLRHKHDKASGISDDPNTWHVWADEPFELVRHLRRLIFLSVETARIVDSLPPSLDSQLQPAGSQS